MYATFNRYSSGDLKSYSICYFYSAFLSRYGDMRTMMGLIIVFICYLQENGNTEY